MKKDESPGEPDPPTLQPKSARPAKEVDGESVVLAAIAAMPDSDRAIGERLHAIIRANAPAFAPKLWYEMPAYAKDGKVICFFRSAEKFKERYMTLGFNADTDLDDGVLWPITCALTALTSTEEAKIAALVKRAAK